MEIAFHVVEARFHVVEARKVLLRTKGQRAGTPTPQPNRILSCSVTCTPFITLTRFR